MTTAVKCGVLVDGTGKPVDGPDEVRRAVRECIAMGAEAIKVFATNIQAGAMDAIISINNPVASYGVCWFWKE